MLSLLRTLRRVSVKNRRNDETLVSPADYPPMCEVPPPPGSWGGLIIQELIGRGAFGEVYRAFDPALDRDVALKLLSEAETQSARVDVLTEGRLLARLRHPNIATVFGADVRDGRAGIWMELVRGRSLQDLVDTNGPFSAKEAALIGVDLSQAVATVHAAGLLHRDIKAQNVMRENGGRIVLLDFGLGLDTRKLMPDEFAGTPPYMAPELLHGGTPTVRTDVFALGVTLYFLVSGLLPRGGRPLREVRPELPEVLLGAVERALDEAPSRRLSSAASLCRQLHLVLGVDRATKRERCRAWLRRRAALVLLVVLGFCAATWYVLKPVRYATPTLWIVNRGDSGNSVQVPELEDLFKRQIAQSPFVRVFGEASVPGTLQRMGLTQIRTLPDAVRRKVAWRSNVSHLVYSTIISIGSEKRLKVVVEEVRELGLFEGGRTEKEFPFGDGNTIYDAIRDAANWIREVAGEQAAIVHQNSYLLTDATTPSAAALRDFNEGERAYDEPNQASDVRWASASSKWQDALVKDPDFVQPLMRLGDAARAHGRDLESVKYYARAEKLLGRRKLDEREEYRIRAALLYDSGDILGADEVHARWAHQFPDDYEPLLKRANPLMESGRPREALEVLRAAERLNPTNRLVAWNIAMCHLMLGDMDSIATYTARMREAGDTANADLMDATVRLFKGDNKGALEIMVKVRERSRQHEEAAARIDAVVAIASLYADLGLFAKAASTVADDLTPGESTGDEPTIAMEYVVLAELRLDAGDMHGARSAAKKALDRELGPHILRRAGPVLVRTGAADEAISYLRKYEKDWPGGAARKWRIFRLPRLMIEGEISLRTGDVRRAFELLHEASLLDRPGWPREYMVRAYELLNEKETTLRITREIIQGRALFWRMPKLYPCGVWRWALDGMAFAASSNVALGERVK